MQTLIYIYILVNSLCSECLVNVQLFLLMTYTITHTLFFFSRKKCITSKHALSLHLFSVYIVLSSQLFSKVGDI